MGERSTLGWMGFIARLAVLATLVCAGAVHAQPEEAWGDEWFDEAGAAEARAIESEMVRDAGGQQVAPASTRTDPRSAQVEAERVIVPPRHGIADLEAAWRTRREARLRQDDATAREAEALLRRLLLELDVPEVHAFAAAAARESRKLEATSPEEALRRAELAVALAPSLPAAHLQLLRAQLAHDPAALGKLVGITSAGVKAGLRDPRALRALVADLVAALGAALLVAGAVALLVLAAAHARNALHDFHHLFPRSVSPVQTGLLAAMLLALPLALGFGPLVVAALLLAALWIYLDLAERVALGSWLALAALLPAAAGWMVPRLAWDDTPAAALYAVERAGDFSGAAALRQAAHDPRADAATLFVAARAAKRLGALDEAAALYERALAARPRWPEAAVNLGNVRFLQGDRAEAETLYARAVDLDPGIAAAYFGLSRVHYDRMSFSQGQAARSKALDLDPGLVERYARAESGATPANQYLADARLPDAELAAAARRTAEAARVEQELSLLLLGPIPTLAVPFAGGGFVLLLAALASWVLQRMRPASGCSRCGRPVCAACDPESAGGNLCGQCVNVYGRRAVVDASARELKERAVRAHQTRRALGRRLAIALLAGPLATGRVARGATWLLLGWTLIFLAAWPSGLVRPAFDGWPASWKLAVLVPAIAVVFLLARRDARGVG